MKDHCFIGVDVGSASVRAGVFDQQGQRLAFAVRSITQYHPRPGVVEQSSGQIWQQVCEAIKEAVSHAGIAPESVVSLGFDATCSLVMVDLQGRGISVAEGGEAERDIIMWMDHRAVEEAQAGIAKVALELSEKGKLTIVRPTDRML